MFPPRAAKAGQRFVACENEAELLSQACSQVVGRPHHQPGSRVLLVTL